MHKNVRSSTAHIGPHLETMQMSISTVEWITKPWCIHNMENSTSNGCGQSLTMWNSMDYSYKYKVEKWSQTQKNMYRMISFLENLKCQTNLCYWLIFMIFMILMQICAHALGENGSDRKRPWGVFAGCWPRCFLIWMLIPYLWSRNNINTYLIGVLVLTVKIQGMR